MLVSSICQFINFVCYLLRSFLYLFFWGTLPCSVHFLHYVNPRRRKKYPKNTEKTAFFWLFPFILGQSSFFGHTVAHIYVICTLMFVGPLQWSFLESHVILCYLRKDIKSFVSFLFAVLCLLSSPFVFFALNGGGAAAAARGGRPSGARG